MCEQVLNTLTNNPGLQCNSCQLALTGTPNAQVTPVDPLAGCLGTSEVLWHVPNF